MESVYRCVAGIDVHKSMLAVVVRQERIEKAGMKEASEQFKAPLLHAMIQ